MRRAAKNDFPPPKKKIGGGQKVQEGSKSQAGKDES